MPSARPEAAVQGPISRIERRNTTFLPRGSERPAGGVEERAVHRQLNKALRILQECAEDDGLREQPEAGGMRLDQLVHGGGDGCGTVAMAVLCLRGAAWLDKNFRHSAPKF